MFPGSADDVVAETLAVFFNRFSFEFEPLEPVEIPRTKNVTYLYSFRTSWLDEQIKDPGAHLSCPCEQIWALACHPSNIHLQRDHENRHLATNLEAGICHSHSKM